MQRKQPLNPKHISLRMKVACGSAPIKKLTTYVLPKNSVNFEKKPSAESFSKVDDK